MEARQKYFCWIKFRFNGCRMLGIFLDTETNGLNSQTHKILEIAFKIVDVNTGEIKDEYETTVSLTTADWDKSDPASLKINNFTWDEVSKGKEEGKVSQEIIECFAKWKIQRKKAVFICQNPSFDRVFFSKLISPEKQESLNWPYHWLDLASMHWALAMERAIKQNGPLPWDTGFSKDMIASHYNLSPEEKPHRAMNGASHLLLCYKAVVGFPKR